MYLLLIFVPVYVLASYIMDRTVCVWMWRRHYREMDELDAMMHYKKRWTPEEERLRDRRCGGWKPNPIFPLGLMGFK